MIALGVLRPRVLWLIGRLLFFIVEPEAYSVEEKERKKLMFWKAVGNYLYNNLELQLHVYTTF